MEHAAVEGARDAELARQAVRAADAQVAGAVDGEAGVVLQALRQQVRDEPLDDAAAVQPHAGRAGDGALRVADLDLLPAGVDVGCGRSAGRGQGKRHGQRKRVDEIAGVARGLELTQQGRIDQPIAGAGRVERRLHEQRHVGAHRDRSAWVGVQE